MAGKGGGSWKVAYADFVTAMMAFFMVMWIGSQDQKTRQAVANYFIDPSGVSKRPAKTGAVFDSVTGGQVPAAEKTAMGKGRNSHTAPNEGSWATKLVGEFIVGDAKTNDYWREQTIQIKRKARSAPEVLGKQQTVEEASVSVLARRLKEEMVRAIPSQATGVYQDLLYGGVSEVNWTELAEDLVKACKE
jgi:flagellar motor protein MotB